MTSPPTESSPTRATIEGSGEDEETITLPVLSVAPSALHGLGVFCDEAVTAGTILERCPVLVIPAEQRELVDETIFGEHYFEWDGGDGALALGYGSLYNHSFAPNVGCEIDPDEGTIDFIALTGIAAGDELCINYAPDPDEGDELWFDPR